MLLLLVSCQTVTLKTLPDKATVREGEKVLGSSPLRLNVWNFGKRTIQLEKDGYEALTIELTSDSVKRVPFVFSKRFTVETEPAGASVMEGDRELGKTPCEFLLPYSEKPYTLTLRKDGRLSVDIKVDVEKGPLAFRKELLLDGPARRRPQLIIALNEIPKIVWHVNDTSQMLDDAKDNCEQLYQFSDAYPIDMVAYDAGNKCILTMTCEKKKDELISDVWLEECDVASQTSQRLTKGESLEFSGVLINGGKTLICASYRSGRTDFWRLERGASEDTFRLVMTNSKLKTNMRTSTDGTHLLYICKALDGDDETPAQIWRQNVDFHHANAFCICEGTRGEWSPDGNSIVYQNGTPSGLYIIHFDGSRQRRLLEPAEGCEDIHPNWSPDGKRIVFSSNRGNENKKDYSIWCIDVDGGNLKRLTSSPSRDDLPFFTADGKSILFRSNRNQHWGIWKKSL